MIVTDQKLAKEILSIVSSSRSTLAEWDMSLMDGHSFGKLPN